MLIFKEESKVYHLFAFKLDINRYDREDMFKGDSKGEFLCEITAAVTMCLVRKPESPPSSSSTDTNV